MTMQETERVTFRTEQAFPLYTVRQYGGGADFHMVNEWHRWHGAGELRETILPPDGFIAQEDGRDVAAVWCYFATGIGVGHVEWLVSAPGLSVERAKAAIKALVDFLWLHAQANGYGALLFHCVPAASRIAGYLGLEVASKGQVTLIKSQ